MIINVLDSTFNLWQASIRFDNRRTPTDVTTQQNDGLFADVANTTTSVDPDQQPGLPVITKMPAFPAPVVTSQRVDMTPLAAKPIDETSTNTSDAMGSSDISSEKLDSGID